MTPATSSGLLGGDDTREMRQLFRLVPKAGVPAPKPDRTAERRERSRVNRRQAVARDRSQSVLERSDCYVIGLRCRIELGLNYE